MGCFETVPSRTRSNLKPTRYREGPPTHLGPVFTSLLCHLFTFRRGLSFPFDSYSRTANTRNTPACTQKPQRVRSGVLSAGPPGGGTWGFPRQTSSPPPEISVHLIHAHTIITEAWYSHSCNRTNAGPNPRRRTLTTQAHKIRGADRRAFARGTRPPAQRPCLLYSALVWFGLVRFLASSGHGHDAVLGFFCLPLT